MRLPRNLITLGLGLTLLNAGLATAAEELPAPIRMVQEKGARILGSFDAPDGLRGYAAEYQNQGMALYLTPDGKHVLTGHLFDAQGKDLSREPLERLVYAPLAKEMWQKMEQSAWIADGRADAPRVVYLFSDPNCPYCTMFWEQARPCGCRQGAVAAYHGRHHPRGQRSQVRRAAGQQGPAEGPARP